MQGQGFDSPGWAAGHWPLASIGDTRMCAPSWRPSVIVCGQPDSLVAPPPHLHCLSVIMLARKTLFLSMAALLAGAGSAGVWQGHRKSSREPQDLRFNYQPARASTNAADAPPAAFSWCSDAPGRPSMCTASWNQHISTPFKPGYCGSCWAHATLSMLQVRGPAGGGGPHLHTQSRSHPHAAHAATSHPPATHHSHPLQDRLKIAKGGGIDIMLGRQSLLNCAGFHGHGDGCNGGDTIDVFK